MSKNQKNTPSKVVETAAKEPVVDELQAQVAQLSAQLAQATESEKRALADYRNVLRRTQEERVKMIKLAAASVIEKLLQPLEHLHLAAKQLNDTGLNMVEQQFIQALAAEGVEEIMCVGKVFDPHTMEVVDRQPARKPEEAQTVLQVTRRGYTLNGEVLQVAQVVVAESMT